MTLIIKTILNLSKYSYCAKNAFLSVFLGLHLSSYNIWSFKLFPLFLPLSDPFLSFCFPWLIIPFCSTQHRDASPSCHPYSWDASGRTRVSQCGRHSGPGSVWLPLYWMFCMVLDQNGTQRPHAACLRPPPSDLLSGQLPRWAWLKQLCLYYQYVW